MTCTGSKLIRVESENFMNSHLRFIRGPVIVIIRRRLQNTILFQIYMRQNQDNRDLKQATTATAVNKQLNFTVKNKTHTTNHIYCILEAYFMIKSV